MTMRNRVEKLERNYPKKGVVVMWRHHTETDEQARTRWCAEHPGQNVDRAGLRVILVRWADPQSVVAT